jgi:hypothetical protein
MIVFSSILLTLTLYFYLNIKKLDKFINIYDSPDSFRKFHKNRIPKIVFIHGVGEGVLKSELDFMLGRYENIIFQDGNYQKYGLGATEVYFKQNKF